MFKFLLKWFSIKPSLLENPKPIVDIDLKKMAKMNEAFNQYFLTKQKSAKKYNNVDSKQDYSSSDIISGGYDGDLKKMSKANESVDKYFWAMQQSVNRDNDFHHYSGQDYSSPSCDSDNDSGSCDSVSYNIDSY